MYSDKTLNSIAATNYFESRKTWIFRIVQFSIGVLVLYIVDLAELTNGLTVLYVCSFLLAALLVALPVDDLVLDDQGIHFVKRSLIPFFNRIKTYSTSLIKRIAFGTMSGVPSVFSLLIPVVNTVRIEFTFQDDSSKSEDIVIRKRDLQHIVSEFRRVKGLH